jgi:hypothetical protein
MDIEQLYVICLALEHLSEDSKVHFVFTNGFHKLTYPNCSSFSNIFFCLTALNGCIFCSYIALAFV